MKYYSTNNRDHKTTLDKAINQGLAEDKGLFMPEHIKRLPQDFFENISQYSFQQIAYTVSEALFGEDIDKEKLQNIITEALNFDIPLINVENNIYSLELFHGPTMAFKDVGARCMARLLAHFNNRGEQTVHVLVATSGDTGSAVANGFLGVEGIHVHVLYPKGLVSEIQECQFTTLGQNITAIAIDGTFDDCQRLVKMAFLDKQLNQQLNLTSANSINVARFLPQSFYYFYAYAQLKKMHPNQHIEPIYAVPSGNFGNLTAGIIAKKMGLPIKRFIAANNQNDIFLKYLQTGTYNPRPSIATIANAMDVGDPSNFSRILDLHQNNHTEITKNIHGYSYTDLQIANTITQCYQQTGYLLDPHGACAYEATKMDLKENEYGIFLETAHPIKFQSTMERIIGEKLPIPEKLQKFIHGKKQIVEMDKTFEDFKNYLLS